MPRLAEPPFPQRDRPLACCVAGQAREEGVGMKHTILYTATRLHIAELWMEMRK